MARKRLHNSASWEKHITEAASTFERVDIVVGGKYYCACRSTYFILYAIDYPKSPLLRHM